MASWHWQNQLAVGFRRWIVGVVAVVVVFGACGCSSTALSKASSGQGLPCPQGANVTVSPSTVQRDAAVTLTLLWTVAAVTDEVTQPHATLSCGPNYSIEVDVPLLRDPSQDTSDGLLAYTGSVLNPYGSGAPAGNVSVLATGQPPDGCSAAPSSATTFALR